MMTNREKISDVVDSANFSVQSDTAYADLYEKLVRLKALCKESTKLFEELVAFELPGYTFEVDPNDIESVVNLADGVTEVILIYHEVLQRYFLENDGKEPVKIVISFDGLIIAQGEDIMVEE